MKITATIDDESEIVQIVLEEQGLVTRKKMLFENFLNILNKADKKPELNIAIPELPTTYVAGNIQPAAKPSGTMALYVKGDIQRMSYESGKDNILVPFPSLILVFKLKEGRLQKSLAFAVKETDISKVGRDTVLFNYPYGNVSPYSGNICWGQNRHNEFSSFKQLDALVAKFITSPTNNDLYVEGQSVSSTLTLPCLVTEQAERNFFDNTLLVSSGKTLEDVFKEI